MKFRVDPAVWAGVTPARQREIRDALTDLNLAVDGAEPTVRVCLVDRGPPASVRLDVVADTEVRAACQLPERAFQMAMRDYRDIIVQLDRAAGGSFGMRDLDTLDYAKKLVHDEAADLIVAALAPHVELPHAIARRVFTLTFLVASDLPEQIIARRARHSDGGGA